MKWTKSLWLTRAESQVIVINGASMERSVKVGLTVESDERELSRDMYEAADKALNVIMEQERENWMNEEKMRIENEKLKLRMQDAIECIDEKIEEGVTDEKREGETGGK